MSPTAYNTGGQRGLLPETRSKPGSVSAWIFTKTDFTLFIFRGRSFLLGYLTSIWSALSHQVPKANCIWTGQDINPNNTVVLLALTGCGRKDVVCMCEYIRIRMSFNGQVCIHIRGICYSDRTYTVQQNDSNRTGHR